MLSNQYELLAWANTRDDKCPPLPGKVTSKDSFISGEIIKNIQA